MSVGEGAVPDLRDLPLREVIERVCLLIADPPAEYAMLGLSRTLRLVPGVGKGLARTIADTALTHLSKQIGALNDGEVERVCRALQGAVHG